jgi:hypothetical protein
VHRTDLRRGDHIRVKRPGGYYHHGIYIGYGTVIHFSDPVGYLKWDATVRRDKLADFGPSDKIEVVQYPSFSTQARETTVLIAIRLIGSTGYHLTRNNCEQFATFCKTGRHESIQVEGARVAVRILKVVGGELRVVRALDRYLETKMTPDERRKIVFPKLFARNIRRVDLQRLVDSVRELIAQEDRGNPTAGIDAAIVEVADALKKNRVPEEWIPELLGTARKRVADAYENLGKKSP